jgi:hypothetical protein
MFNFLKKYFSPKPELGHKLKDIKKVSEKSNKYRGSLEVRWNTESELEAQELEKTLKTFLKEFNHVFSECFSTHYFDVKIKNLADSKPIKLVEVPIQKVFDLIGQENSKLEVDGKQYKIRLTSSRFKTFKESLSCASCGLTATKAFIEKCPQDVSPLVNFYAEEDGKLVLFTRDHIHPKSKGGKNIYSNYQTMCSTCNNLKGNSDITLEQLRQLRIALNENKNKITRKELAVLLQTTRDSFKKPQVKKPLKKLAQPKITIQEKLMVKEDIVLVKKDGEIWAKHTHAVQSNVLALACIPRQSIIKPLMTFQGMVYCSTIDDGISFFIDINLTKQVT